MTTSCEPAPDCALCPRLVELRNEWQQKEPDWHNAPVPTWLPTGGALKVKLLVVGMAPGARGANRTGRPFTGDYAGDLLYATLSKFGLAKGQYGAEANDSLALKDTAITNAVRCLPPQNKPVGAEVNSCRPFLVNTIAGFPNLKVMVTLGKIAHDSLARTLGERLVNVPFGHNRIHDMAGRTVISSYHCSRYNTNTGRLTEKMFEDVFEQVVKRL